MNKKVQALVVLIIMLGGYIATFHSQTPFGIIINHGFLAGFIGGLADWFAVVALFRKPLGFVSFRSEVLPRNRERITKEIIAFVSKDLLNQAYLTAHLSRYNLIQLLSQYYQKHVGIKGIQAILEQWLPAVKPRLASIAMVLVNTQSRELQEKIDISAELDKYWQTKAGLDTLATILNMAEQQIIDSFQHEEVRNFLQNELDIIQDEYKGSSNMRAMMFTMANLNSSKISQKIINFVTEYIDKCFQPNSAELLQVQRILNQLIAYFTRKMLTDINKDNTWVDLQSDILQLDRLPHLMVEQFARSIDEYCRRLEHDTDAQNHYNKLIIDKVVTSFMSNRQVIEVYMHQQMTKYSKEQFVDLVEAKVSDDLQMIRINGSVVGFIAGVGLTIITMVSEVLVR